MTKKNPNTNKENLPTEGTPVPPNLQRHWEEVQRKYFPDKFSLIDYKTASEKDRYWRWHLDISSYKSPLSMRDWVEYIDYEKEATDFDGNLDLKTIFQPKYRKGSTAWTKMEPSILSKGFFIPKGEIVHLEKEKMAAYLVYLKLFSASFPFVEFLRKIKEEKERAGMAEIPYPLIALWEYIPLYAKAIKSIAAKYPKPFKNIKKVLGRTISVVNFSQKLPSEQVWDLIQSEFQVQYFAGMTLIEQKTLAKNAHPEVQVFWLTYADSIRFILENGYPAITKRSIGNRKMIFTGKEVAAQYYHLFRKELEWVKIQEIMDPIFENQYSSLPLDNTRWKFRPDRGGDLATTIKETIGDKSILDRIKESASSEVEYVRPHFAPILKNWINEDAQKWYDFTRQERTDLLASAAKDLTIFQHEKLDETVKERWNIYLQQLGNQIFSPFFQWVVVAGRLLPQWNVLDPGIANDLDKQFYEKHLREIKERKWLKAVTDKLYSRTTLQDAQKVVDNVDAFSFEHLQEQWDKTVKAQLAAIRHKGEYRLRRMREFGMIYGNKQPDKTLEIWLDEMLQIEKEIGPYIPFVQKAFLMALPVKTTVEFDPYRHSHDGIEFDPDTTQDQHKWLRGEVMKSLRMRVGKADAEQINAFALDFSGSMRHKRMRNLFKILYLMVMGLEDRKSYDAFHFFGSDFIENVNFSGDYTNRSLLFRILKQIARIDYEGVRYGGIGGTNMSEGIIGCHERIKRFAAEMKAKYPKRFFLKSIFVITDGEPSLGIHLPEALNKEIEKRRKDGSIAIKGIYLRPEDEEFGSFMERIFGKDQFVETDDFAEAINRLVYIMTQTYKQQRKDLRQQKIKEKYERSRNLYQ